MAALASTASVVLYVLARALVALLLLITALLFVLSFLLGPLFLALVPLAVVGALAFEPLFRRRAAQRAVDVAQSAGARGRIQVWGYVTAATGSCPDGALLARGAAFAVSLDRVTPSLCPHVAQAVVAAAARMQRGETLPDLPVRYHDAAHAVEVELHRESVPVRPPVGDLRVVGLRGVCPRGYKVGDIFSCTPQGSVQPGICPIAARALRAPLAAMVRHEPGAPRTVVCPIPEHMLEIELAA
jgi:hypothetical protein